MSKEKHYLKEEIRREFQLERMILFSDAVFAIVITLMAIEIRVPEIEGKISSHELSHELFNMLPLFIAYVVSFFFIGHTWYQHLQIFSLLKDYDKGLVIRNLIMLFFMGFFPFSAALMAKLNNGLELPVIIYFFVIFSCKGAQLILQHYILVKKPELRINASINEELLRFKKSRLAVIMLVCVFMLVVITNNLISDPEQKHVAWLWFVPFPIILKFFQKRLKVKS